MKVAHRQSQLRTLSLVILAVIATGFAFDFLEPVLVPLVLAFFFATGLSPLLDWQRRHLKIPAPVALVLTLAAGVALLTLVGFLLTVAIEQIAENSEVYQKRIKSLSETVIGRLPLAPFDLTEDDISERLDELQQTGLKSMATAILGAMGSLISTGLLVFFFMIFMLLGESTSPSSLELITEIRAKIRRYIVTKTGISAMTGILTGGALEIIGVDLAFLFGILAFLLNFIPNIGSIIAIFLPIPIAFLDPDLSTASKVLSLAIPGSLQLVIGNVIEPRLMGKSLDMHPVTILAALVFFGMIWGLAGMFLATPIAAALVIVSDKLELTELFRDAFTTPEPPPA